MWKSEFKKYLGIFVVGVALIAVYKTFDSLDKLFGWGRSFLALLTPFIVGGCIAYILAIPCRKIEQLCNKTKLRFLVAHRRGIAIAFIYLLFLAVVVLLLVAILPALFRNITQFAEQLPSLVKDLVYRFNNLGIYTIDQSIIEKLLTSGIFAPDKLLDSITFDNVNRYAKGVMNFGNSLFNIFLGLIVSIYLLFDRQNLRQRSLWIAHSFIREKHRKVLGRYLSKIHEFITLYISCQLVDAIIVFILSFLALALLQVNYAPLLALMVGAMNLIPYFGAIVATILAGLITMFTNSFTFGLIVVAVLIVLQQLDANFIQPKLLSGSLNIKPVWVILSIVVGGGLFGILGIFLGVPVFALLRIIILDILELREKQGSLTVPASPPPDESNSQQ